MNRIETLESLSGRLRAAVVDLLYRLADDELVSGNRNAYLTGPAPIPEADAALAEIAQDEMRHAFAYYEMLHALGERDPDVLAFARPQRKLRCAPLTCLSDNGDWVFCIVRQFLYDAAETVRLAVLADGTLVPLAQLATRIRGEEEKHLKKLRGWLMRLTDAVPDGRERMRTALTTLYPYALGIFEPTAADETLAYAGICSTEEEHQLQWESAVAPALAEAGLDVPDTIQTIHGSRTGQYRGAIAHLLNDLQFVRPEPVTR